MGAGAGRRRRGERRPAPVVAIVDRHRPRSDARFLRKVVAEALRHGGRPDAEVSLLLTGDAGIAELHGRFLGDASPTDVMSFDTDGSIDVVVNVACARREAVRRGSSLRAELALYVVHGVLHACGFDDTSARARRVMRAAEREVMHSLGLRYAAVD